MTLDEIRRRPTLPGRFQPSTISVLRLNFCVRDGNRWVPQAIVTGNSRGECLLLPPFWYRRFGQTTASRLPSLSVASGLSAPSKPHRLEIRFPLTKILPLLYSKLFRFSAFASSTNHWLRDSLVLGFTGSASLAISRTLF